MSVADASVDGLHSWTTTFNQTTSTEITYPSAGQKTVTTMLPDLSLIVQNYTEGRLTSAIRKNNAGAQIGRNDYLPDTHGRLWIATDARTGTTTYQYYDDDRVKSVT